MASIFEEANHSVINRLYVKIINYEGHNFLHLISENFIIIKLCAIFN